MVGKPQPLLDRDLDSVFGGAGGLMQLVAHGADDRNPGDFGDDTLQGGGGDDTFHGGEGNDTVIVSDQYGTVSLQQFQDALTLANPDLNMQVGADGMVTFTDASGVPASVSGTLDLGGGNVLTFTSVERFHLINNRGD